MENKLEELSKVLDNLQEKQEQIDRKTRDAEEYRQMNNKLVQNVTVVCISFAIIIVTTIIACSIVLSQFVSKYVDANSVITTTTTDISTGSEGIILNDVNDTEISNDSK